MSELKLDTEQASAYLKSEHGIDRAPGTLMVLRVRGGGPTFVKIGRQVRYTPSALDAYATRIISPPMQSTSDVGARQAA